MVRDEVHGQVPEEPTPQAAGTEHFSLDVEDLPAAGLRPGVLAEPRPQERVQRHTVEHIVDLVRVAPMVQILDAPVPQTVEQLLDILRRTHHSSRGQTIARAGVWGHELNCTATIRDPLPHTPAGALQPL